MINKKLLLKWIAALRSRKYKQGTGSLRQIGPTTRSVDRFCCLGVLCDIVNPKMWNKLGCCDSYTYQGKKDYYGDAAHLPCSVYEKIGDSIDEDELITMNDDGIKFYEIANYLERNYL